MISIHSSHWDAVGVLVCRCSPKKSISSLTPLITKGVGGIRVSCYDPVTLLEHGRMRLRAQHVNKGGGHICKTHRWPHGASGHLGSHLALRPLGELWCPPGASWHLRYGRLPVEAQLSRYLIAYQHSGLLRHSFPALAASRLFSQVARWSHEGLTTFFKYKTMCVKS